MKPDFSRVPSHIKHAVTAPSRKEEAFGFERMQWKIYCKCGWALRSKTFSKCERLGQQHLNRSPSGDS